MRPLTMACTALLGLLTLGGCTASDVLLARQLTIIDGAAYVSENHARRQEVRRQLYDFENEVISSCKDWARAAKFDEDMGEAQRRVNICLDFLEGAYPSLATIELLREGADALDELRKRRDASPAEPPTVTIN